MDIQPFSVAMSVYKNDCPQHFKEALESIINQTVPPSEIILVVDGPVSDDLMSVISEYKLKFAGLRPIFIMKNSGLGNALRAAVNACSYELVARMDSDDISAPDRFEKQLECFRKDDSLSLVGSAVSEFMFDKDNAVGRRVVPTKDKCIKKYLKIRCPFNHMTVMFRKSDVLKAGNYVDWFWNEDYYLWIRMYEIGCRFANLPESLVKVRVNEQTYKRRGGMKYFVSEAGLQRYMFDRNISWLGRYIFNVSVRFILQVLMPVCLRGIIYRKFARKR